MSKNTLTEKQISDATLRVENTSSKSPSIFDPVVVTVNDNVYTPEYAVSVEVPAKYEITLNEVVPEQIVTSIVTENPIDLQPITQPGAVVVATEHFDFVDTSTSIGEYTPYHDAHDTMPIALQIFIAALLIATAIIIHKLNII